MPNARHRSPKPLHTPNNKSCGETEARHPPHTRLRPPPPRPSFSWRGNLLEKSKRALLLKRSRNLRGWQIGSVSDDRLDDVVRRRGRHRRHPPAKRTAPHARRRAFVSSQSALRRRRPPRRPPRRSLRTDGLEHTRQPTTKAERDGDDGERGGGFGRRVQHARHG